MAGYIGSQTPVVSNGSQRKYTFTATAAQTVFTGMDIPNPQQIQVFQNGVRLVITTDYTVSSGTTVTLVNAASAGDSLVVILFADYQLLDTDALTFTGGTTIEGDLTVDTNTLYVDSTNNNVGIGTSTPSNNHANANNLVVGNGTAGGIANYVGTGLGWYAFSRDNANNSDAYDGGISYDGSRNLMFHTNAGTERMRIDSSGNLLVGTTSTFDNVSFLLAQILGGLATKINTTASTSQISFFNPNGRVGFIATSGTTTSYSTSSDYRLKENVTDVTDGITRVKQLEPKRFNFIAEPDTIVDGFLAHEAQTVIPEAVTGTHNEVDTDGNPVYQGIDQSKLVPLLTAALKESIAKIEALEARVTALEGN